ncbi:branched-chain amino acid ABC transporter permease [Ruminococcaceae bacterium OttesenSCG-928-A16]|nr:branched-chain amino acid ABC transporter permease [Ruminococcaceae bacterium OttesenSCG-928-A16]
MVQVILNGLMIGGVYSLIAVGLTMVHGVMKIVNFAQGDFLMVGMYATLLLYGLLTPGAAPYVLILPVAVIMFLFGLMVFRTTIYKVIGKGDSNYILLTLGLSYLLQNIAQLIFGPDYRSLAVSNDLKFASISLADNFISVPRLVAFGAALILVILMSFFLNKTDIGRAMRATAEDRTIATGLGVNTKVIYILAFGLGTVFAGISGLLLTPIFFVYPLAGAPFSSIAMTVIVLGGLGNIKGAMVGGIIIGLVESFVSGYVNLEMAKVAIDLVLLLVLMFKPFGLFGKGARKA